MKTNKSLTLPDIEPLKESDKGQLQSGFSNALSSEQLYGGLPFINIYQCNCENDNCAGANCAAECGVEPT